MSFSFPFRLGMDLDGVNSGWKEGFKEWLVKETGRPPSDFPEPQHFSLVKSGWFTTNQEFLDAFVAAANDGMYRRLPVLPGAQPAWERLTEAGVSIAVVTQRYVPGMNKDRVLEDTVAWLDTNSFPYSEIHIVDDKTDIPTGVDMYVDDAPHHIVALQGAGHKVVVFDQLYNRDVEGHARTSTWDGHANSVVSIVRKEQLSAARRMMAVEQSRLVPSTEKAPVSPPTPLLPSSPVTLRRCGKPTLGGYPCRRVGVCPVHRTSR